MLLHSGTLSWLRANQSLLLLRHATYSVEKQQIHIFTVFGLTQPWLEPTIYLTWGKHAHHYTTDAVDVYICKNVSHWNTFMSTNELWQL